MALGFNIDERTLLLFRLFVGEQFEGGADAGGFEQIGIAHINTSLSALGQWNRNQPILDPNQGEVSTERNVAPSDRARLSELARQAELSNRQRAVAFTAMRYPSLAVST